MFVTVARALELIGAEWRRRWFGLVPVAAVTALLEMTAAAAVFVLVRLITDPAAADTIEPLAWLRPWLGSPDAAATTALVAAAVAVLFVLKGALRLAEVYLRERWVYGALADLSNRTLAIYLHAPYSFHLRHSSAELMRNVHESCFAVCGIALHSFAIALNEVLLAGAVVAVLLWVTPISSLVVAAIVVLLAVTLLWSGQRLTSRWGARLHGLSADKLRVAQHALGAAKEVRLLGRAEYFLARQRQVLEQQAQVEVAWGTFQWLPRLAVETIFVCGIAAVVLVAYFTGTSQWLLAPTLGIFGYSALRLLPSFHLILHHLSRIQLAHTSVSALYRDYVTAPPQVPAAEIGSLPAFKAEIRLEGVSFHYENESRPALRSVDVVIRCGESIGVVGSTGAGKSTLIDVVLGLLPPSAGTVRVDGKDIHQQIRAWQRQVGYVPQQVYLLDASIYANIAFAIEDDEIDKERVCQVVRMAQLEARVASLPQGLDTLVGERGVRLSGGERQRIAIARALYHDPSVLVFDEATSALDNRTERELTETIAGLQGQKTMVIVAHRLSTVRNCDRLVLLSNGAVAAIGTYDELLRNPSFERLASL
ncbi:MAG TPA: ABC transporter ATP-binding protein [Terriglobales bacterium]|nr:ABC transporter ATP-binding protein [Terriglobales bacterium]